MIHFYILKKKNKYIEHSHHHRHIADPGRVPQLYLKLLECELVLIYSLYVFVIGKKYFSRKPQDEIPHKTHLNIKLLFLQSPNRKLNIKAWSSAFRHFRSM